LPENSDFQPYRFTIKSMNIFFRVSHKPINSRVVRQKNMSWVPWGLEPKMTVLAKSSSNLPKIENP
jgi:hypothetical protein